MAPSDITGTLAAFRRNIDNDARRRQAPTRLPIRYDDNDYLLRFLRVAKYDLTKASERLFNLEAWEDEHLGSDHHPMTAVRFLDVLGSGMLTTLPAPGPLGHTVLFSDYSKFNFNAFRKEHIVQALYYLFEQLLQRRGAQLAGTGVAVIADATNFGWSDLTSEVQHDVIRFLQDRLPVRVGTIALCHHSAVMSMVWGIVRPFVNAKLRERVQLVGSKGDGLETFFGPTQIPASLGGSLDPKDVSEDFNLLREFVDEETEEIELSGAVGPGDFGVEGMTVGPFTFARDVISNTPAHQIGIQQFDIILTVNGKPVTSAGNLVVTPDVTHLSCRVKRTVQDVWNRKLTDLAAAQAERLKQLSLETSRNNTSAPQES